jgi:hypothetical protein
MRKTYKLIAVFMLSCLALGNAEQKARAHHDLAHQDRADNPAAIPKAPDPTTPDAAQQRCYPGSEEGVSCDGLSAKASVDQARDADEGAALLWPQFAVGLATLLAAGAAAIFAKVAADHTKRAADAADRQVVISDDTARRQLRAYVDFRDVSVSSFRPGATCRFSAKIYNSGQTPAYDVKCICTLHAEADSNGVKAKVRFQSQDRSDARNVVSPGQDSLIFAEVHDFISDEVIIKLKKDSYGIVFAGVLSYRDAFGKLHRSTFKNYLDVSYLDATGSGRLVACERGNYGN